jgi:serine/threonine protein kinase
LDLGRGGRGFRRRRHCAGEALIAGWVRIAAGVVGRQEGWLLLAWGGLVWLWRDCWRAGGDRVGAYRIERVVGRGGMGVVYAAWDQRLERRVAIKLVAPELVADPAFSARFLQEARIAAGFDHPHKGPIRLPALARW